MNEIFSAIQANIIPIALALVVVGVCINLLKGVLKLGVVVAGIFVIAKLAGVL